MPEKSDNSFKLWQELKRRKVFRVIAMYAASAFIILEAVDIIFPRWGLPDWSVNLVILLLIIGFAVTFVLAWVFDITPEGIKKTESSEIAREKEVAQPRRRRLRFSDIIIAILVVVVCVLLYPKVFKKDKFEDIRDADGRISVAVMPFQNLSGDTLSNGMELGLQNLLITKLSNSEELSVRQTQTMYDFFENARNINYASITPSVASDIALKLDANTAILGNLHKYGNNLRITANLLDSRSEEIYKSFEIDGDSEDNFFTLSDSLTILIKNHLEIKVIEQDIDPSYRNYQFTNSSKAFLYFTQGLRFYFEQDFLSALQSFKDAINIDPNFAAVYLYISSAYFKLEQMEQAEKHLNNAEKNKDSLPYRGHLVIDYFKAIYGKNHQEEIKIIKQILQIDDQYRLFWSVLGDAYSVTNQYTNAINAYEKAFEIDEQWGGGWRNVSPYVGLGEVYHQNGNHNKEKEIYELGLSILPDHPEIIHRQIICALSQGDTTEANEYIAKYRSFRETEGLDEYWINDWNGMIYQEAEQVDKAMDIFKDLIEEDPQEPWSKFRLGFILINNDINIDEGLDLVSQALELAPDNGYFLYTKGLGCYKKGMVSEAHEILIKGWDLRLLYNHDHYLLLQEVEKALTNQNK